MTDAQVIREAERQGATLYWLCGTAHYRLPDGYFSEPFETLDDAAYAAIAHIDVRNRMASSQNVDLCA